MADPAKVLGFLDVAGRWNPSLTFVMVGEIAVGLGAFAWARRRSTSLLGASMRLPTATRIDRRLLVGGLLFGVGWGLAGFCLGPLPVALSLGEVKAGVFVAAMLAGMRLFDIFDRRAMPPAEPRSRP